MKNDIRNHVLTNCTDEFRKSLIVVKDIFGGNIKCPYWDTYTCWPTCRYHCTETDRENEDGTFNDFCTFNARNKK